MGASVAFASLASCRKPLEKIIPYVNAPENLIPGKPQYYATTMPFGSRAYGLVVESHEGRPTKIEGNKLHPASLGATDARTQAEILNLYDPDRKNVLTHKGQPASWEDFEAFWSSEFSTFASNRGKGLVVLSESFSSPTLERLKKKFQERFPQSVWVHYEPIDESHEREGLTRVFGHPAHAQLSLEKAKRILSLDADFLGNHLDQVALTKAFSKGRDPHVAGGMNRLYVAENDHSLTGGMADKRLRMPSSQIFALAQEIASELKGLGADLSLSKVARSAKDSFASQVAKDLWKHRGEAVVIAGLHQPAEVHALAYELNRVLNGVGRTVSYHKVPEATLSNEKDFENLIGRMRSGKVSTFITLGGNPVFNAPADFDFEALYQKVPSRIHFSLLPDETGKLADWVLPRAHFLESWGDARHIDGTLSLVQPLIRPLFQARSDVSFLGLLSMNMNLSDFDQVQQTWRFSLGNFESEWRQGLHDGVLKKEPLELLEISKASLKGLKAKPVSRPTLKSLELVFQASPAVFDGRYANNAWLQELPDPVTKITWDNVAKLSPQTAKEFNLKDGDLVDLTVGDRKMNVAIWAVPGHAKYSVSLALGYGRTNSGVVGKNAGFNAYAIRDSKNPGILSGVKLSKVGKTYPISCTQDHGSMEGRAIVREGSLDQYKKDPEFAKKMVKHPPLKSLWEEKDYKEGHQWGMTIDLNKCTGCNACVTACQSENNVPVVGKEQVGNAREMHWLRVDRYFAGTPEEAEMVVQPMACHHCENAPCEQVCPVNATVHDDEGLNAMVYNRCIGTRYCSNNCPYKVRRFNFFNYTKDKSEEEKMAMNPDVTIRFRGVMEKCTYCVQRISKAKIDAKNQSRDVKDGDFQVACQQVCPAEAIQFGNLVDPKSEVVQQKNNSRSYDLLAELNVKPRTSYLAKIRNVDSQKGGDS